MDTEKNLKELVSFWNRVFALKEDAPVKELKDMTPSEQLYEAAQSLGSCKKVLDYGCGHGWAGITAAVSGCEDVTCVDLHESARAGVVHYAEQYGVAERVHSAVIDASWLAKQPSGIYDGFFCSNVLDVVPGEIAEGIIKEAARVVTKDAKVVVSLNYYMTKEKAESRGYELKDGNAVYIDGVLRLVSRTDEEWKDMLEKYFVVEKLDYFKWAAEETKTRRLFFLRKKDEKTMVQ